MDFFSLSRTIFSSRVDSNVLLNFISRWLAHRARRRRQRCSPTTLTHIMCINLIHSLCVNNIVLAATTASRGRANAKERRRKEIQFYSACDVCGWMCIETYAQHVFWPLGPDLISCALHEKRSLLSSTHACSIRNSWISCRVRPMWAAHLTHTHTQIPTKWQSLLMLLWLWRPPSFRILHHTVWRSSVEVMLQQKLINGATSICDIAIWIFISINMYGK